MNESNNSLIHPNPWQNLKKFTQARIALGRCGASLPTNELLDFKLSHAQAKDAVLLPLDYRFIQSEIQKITSTEVVLLESAVANRQDYLKRPDLGGILNEKSKNALQSYCQSMTYDISLVISEGLSANAINENIVPFLQLLLPELQAYHLAPICAVEQGRVAIGDAIADILKPTLTVVLIGERPGLQSHNSLGIYLTYQAKGGTTNDKRNCISNIRPAGLSYEEAVSKLLYLIKKAFSHQISGVQLKDEQEGLVIE
jgi:ethanolamine ammonia-lyase small subunit